MDVTRVAFPPEEGAAPHDREDHMRLAVRQAMGSEKRPYHEHYDPDPPAPSSWRTSPASQDFQDADMKIYEPGRR